ncbi:MAG: MFS transporter [Candidatus Moranbacteria bacterium]|jgi:multidrug resistance protein|nr:MFS transporter [Candidatus Moranbacteria bacterium]
MDRKKIIILLTVLVDVLGVGIVIPILPFYVENFGVSPFVLTLLIAVFSLFSFVSAPMLGALSDKIGRRPVLIISIASTAIGWLVFAWAQSVWMLFLGRIIDGMAAGNLPVAESYLVDISKNEKERTKNLGLIGAVFGVGFIIGPALGAALSTISNVFPFYVVGILASINTLAAIIFLPETNGHKNKHKKISLNPLAPIQSAFKMKKLRSRFTAWFLFGIAIAGMHAVFSLYLRDAFGFNAQLAGAVFTAMGIFMIFNQTFLLNRFWLKRFKESSLEVWLFLFFALGFVFLSVPLLVALLIGLIINVMARSVLRVVISSKVAGIAKSEERGEVMGIMSSILFLANIGGPVVAGIFYEVKIYLPFITGAIALVVAFLIMKYCCAGREKDIKINMADEIPEVI